MPPGDPTSSDEGHGTAALVGAGSGFDGVGEGRSLVGAAQLDQRLDTIRLVSHERLVAEVRVGQVSLAGLEERVGCRGMALRQSEQPAIPGDDRSDHRVAGGGPERVGLAEVSLSRLVVAACHGHRAELDDRHRSIVGASGAIRDPDRLVRVDRQLVPATRPEVDLGKLDQDAGERALVSELLRSSADLLVLPVGEVQLVGHHEEPGPGGAGAVDESRRGFVRLDGDGLVEQLHSNRSPEPRRPRGDIGQRTGPEICRSGGQEGERRLGMAEALVRIGRRAVPRELDPGSHNRIGACRVERLSAQRPSLGRGPVLDECLGERRAGEGTFRPGARLTDRASKHPDGSRGLAGAQEDLAESALPTRNRGPIARRREARCQLGQVDRRLGGAAEIGMSSSLVEGVCHGRVGPWAGEGEMTGALLRVVGQRREGPMGGPAVIV
jgi:hypothetical protein